MENKSKINPALVGILLAILPLSCDNNYEVTYDNVNGVYTCSEESVHHGYRRYIIEIDPVGQTENLFIISNFHNLGANEFLYAEVSHDSLLITDQVIGNAFVNGSGIISNDYRRIEMRYFVDDGVVELDFGALFER